MTTPQALFLDRDGTLIVEKHYLDDPGDVELEKTAVSALKIAQEKNIKIILVTNQSGIGRGYFSEETYQQVHERLVTLLAEHNLSLDAAYFCPHHPEKGVGDYQKDCPMRKPAPGMLKKGLDAFQLEAKNCLMVGDKDSDIIAGQAVGMATAFIQTANTSPPHSAPDYTVKTLGEAVHSWVST